MNNKRFLILALCLTNAAGLIGFAAKFATYIGEPTRVVTQIGGGEGYTAIFFEDKAILYLPENTTQIVDTSGDTWLYLGPRGLVFPPWPNYFDVAYISGCAALIAILGIKTFTQKEDDPR